MGVELEDLGGGGGDSRLVCSLAQFKSRRGIADAVDDDAITQVILGVSGQLAGACGRVWGGQPCLQEARRTLVASVYSFQRTLDLPARPVSLVESVREGTDGDFGDGDDLAEGDDFLLDQGFGEVLRVGCYWPYGRRTVQVVYLGGYTGPDVATAEDYEAWAAATEYAVGDRAAWDGRYWECTTAHTSGSEFAEANWHEDFLMPADLVEAALEQAGYVWQRRASLGMSGVSAGQGGSFSDAAGDDLLPAVKATCERYRKLI
jgi:hypothetical protein